MRNIKNKEIKKYIKKIILGNERGHSDVVAETIVKSIRDHNMYKKLVEISAHLNARYENGMKEFRETPGGNYFMIILSKAKDAYNCHSNYSD